MLSGTFLRAIDNDLIVKAQAIPQQSEQGYERSWSCGPNALARFFALSGLDFGLSEQKNFGTFVSHCPRSCGQPTTLTGYASCATLAVGAASCLCAKESNSYLTTAAALALGTAAAAPFIIEGINRIFHVGKVGPTPRWLAGYGNKIMKEQRLEQRLVARAFSDKEELLRAINHQINILQKPVIALVSYGPLMWHYITIYKYNYGSDIEYLNSSSRKENIYTNSNSNHEGLLNQMDFEKDLSTKAIKTALKYFGWIIGVDIGRYNIIHWEDAIAPEIE